MIDLSIIILSYNTKELLRECLLSIRHNKPRAINYEVIVVDNASVDSSAEMVRKEFPDVMLIANAKNLGFSAGNNVGIPKAKGRYVLFLNPDTLVYSKTLETMVKFMDKNLDVGAATCKVLLKNGRLDDSCHRGFPTPWRAFCHFSGLSKIFPKLALFSGYNLTYKSLSSIHEIDSCSGAFMIVRQKAGKEVGWWDEDYFWYGEDLDFCYRLKGRGWKIYFVPTVKILHYKGASSGIKKISKHLTRATLETRRRATNARFSAMKIFYRKHYMDKYPRIITRLVFLGINLKWWFTLRNM